MQPAAAPSRAHTTPRRRACSVSPVAATSISRPKNVPVTATPLPPLSRLQASNRGIRLAACMARWADWISCASPQRYINPPGWYLFTKACNSSTSVMVSVTQNIWPTFSSSVIEARVSSTQAMSSSDK